MKVKRIALLNKLKNQLIYYRPDLWRRFANPQVRDQYAIEGQKFFLDIVDYKGRRRIRISRTNAIFVIDMMNSFDYYFQSVKPFNQNLNNIVFEIVDFSTPRLHEVVGFDDFPILCPTLAEPFITTQQYLEFADLAQGDVVLDLGAYCGLTAISFSKAVGVTGKVVAVEPDPLNYPAAKVNISRHEQINNLHNISLVNFAAGGVNGTIQFSSEGTMGSADISIVGRGRGDVVDVRCLTLSEIAAANDLEHVDFVKMDIEGAEEPVLRGAEVFLQQFRPKLVVEPHMVGGISSADISVRILQSYGYSVDKIHQHGVEVPLILASPG